jgi:hypothetical protein
LPESAWLIEREAIRSSESLLEATQATFNEEGASMRKQDQSIPLELKRDIRLLNSVIDRRKYKRPNAQKYGIFATPVIIPGEDRDEFFELLNELLVEWNPSGPSLRHAVHCLADSMWRLRRLKKAVQTELCTDTFDPKHPAFRESWGFSMFHSYLRSEPETCFEKHAEKYLRPATISDLEQKFPRANYQSASEWAKAVETELISISYEPPASEGRVDYLKEAAREWKIDQQIKGSIVYARELLEYEDKETERLEARIRKQTSYCAELKTWEEMHSRT